MKHLELYRFDKKIAGGCRLVAGVDEAGRGPLAGPVVAAAVILSDNRKIPHINDSKKLSPLQREHLYKEITQSSLSFGVGISSEKEIDRYGIIQATFLAVRRAIKKLSLTPDLIIFDGNLKIPLLKIQQITVVKGDEKSASVAAASIIAKVTRDRLMKKYSEKFPEYKFEAHKGYPTKLHYQIIKNLGPSPIHRYTFKLWQ